MAAEKKILEESATLIENSTLAFRKTLLELLRCEQDPFYQLDRQVSQLAETTQPHISVSY